MPESDQAKNIVITVAAGYREEQIRPFLASLQYFAPNTSLRLIVARFNPEFERAVRNWFQNCSFYLLPPKPLRDFALKRKWAISILKRLAKWSHSRYFAKKLLKINYLRHIVIRDLLRSWQLENANVLLCDSRDLVFQRDPFAGEWPPLWTCEEDKLIGECKLNSSWFKRVGGEAALEQAKHHRITCAGVIGGRVDRIRNYLERSSQIVERISPTITLTDGDQGIHNNLVRLQPDLKFTVLPNGCHLAGNVGYTNIIDLRIDNSVVRLRDLPEVPAILHQYDRHPQLVQLVHSRWANAKPKQTN